MADTDDHARQGIEALDLRPGTRGPVPATTAQEYFWHLSKQEPDAAVFFHPTVLMLEGQLDPAALIQSLQQIVGNHSVFWTRLYEAGDELHQVAGDPTPLVADHADRSPLPEPRWREACDNAVELLCALPFTFGDAMLRARLLTFAPARHALILAIHHAATDGAATDALIREVFGDYAARRTGSLGAPVDRSARLQYLDYAAALSTWAGSAAGSAHRAAWARRLEGAAPFLLPVDHSRAPFDARRDAIYGGIVAERMHPVEHVTLPVDVVTAVDRLAREARSSSYGIYLAALGSFLAAVTGQDDVCIETSFSPRFNLRLHRLLSGVAGLLTSWTIARLDASGRPRLLEATRRVREVSAWILGNGIIPDYYRLVPHALRRFTFNYVPAGPQPPELAPGIRAHRGPSRWPIWKRPWELHLTLVDASPTVNLFWTGAESLFERETVRRLLDEFVDALTRGVATPA